MKIYVKSSTELDDYFTFEISPFEIVTDRSGRIDNIRDFTEHVVDPYDDLDDMEIGLYLMDGNEARELFEKTFLEKYGSTLNPNSSYVVSGTFTIYYQYEYDPELGKVESGSEEVVSCEVDCNITEKSR